MVDNSATRDNDPDDVPDEDSGGRQRSSIGFPYTGLAEAVETASAIYNQVGSGECDDDQLAVWLKLSPKSSGYRVRLSAARMFGLLDTISPGRHRLSTTGFEIVDPNHEREARVKAFLNVPLFSAVFDRWKGRQLPPPAALERELVGLGVAEKQKERARQILERSAKQAGFFEHGIDRLVKPGIAPSEPPVSYNASTEKTSGGGMDGGGHSGLDPIISGLISRLPAPGDVWPEAQRKLWLQILESSFKLVYKDAADASGSGN